MTTVDQQRADAFAGQMLAALNNSATVLMLRGRQKITLPWWAHGP